jgi:hypothetical protein
MTSYSSSAYRTQTVNGITRDEPQPGRLVELAALGVDQFALYLMHDGAAETFEAYRQTVVRAAAGPVAQRDTLRPPVLCDLRPL